MQTMTCVLRNVAGLDQYIPVADAVRLNPDERLFDGCFSVETAKDGPSGSHTRTICLPQGALAARTLRESGCVFREVDGIVQYVPMSEVPFFDDGERVFLGTFRTESVNAGPSGSHRRTICLPVGSLFERRINLN